MRNSIANPRNPVFALAALAALWCHEATATTFITTRGVINGPLGSFEASATTDGVDNSGSLHGGFDGSVLGPAEAFVRAGLGPPCFIQCGQSVGPARTVGEIDTSVGRLRALSSALSGSISIFGSSEMTLQLQDVLVAQSTGDVHFQLHLDAIFSGTLAPSSTQGDATLDFGLFVSTTGFQEFPGAPDAGVAYDSSVATALPHPLTFDRDFVMTGVTAGTELFVTLQLNVDSACGSTAEGTGNCSAAVDAAHTAYLGISGDVESTSGYHYAAYVPAPVPLPASVLLLGGGLFALPWRRARRAPRS